MTESESLSVVDQETDREMDVDTDADTQEDEAADLYNGDDTDTENSKTEPALQLSGKRIALVGRFGGMNRREAKNLLRSYGAVMADAARSVDWIVIGADEPPLAEAELLSKDLLDAAASGTLEILNETTLWQRLGLLEPELAIRRFHTPAMLADLLGISVRVIRRWHRKGLITPVRTLHKLPYFSFQEVATARRLAQWIASGASPQAIEQRLVELVEVLPDIRRPLDQLSILVEGGQVLLRQGAGLLELGGQMRFDFESTDLPLDGTLEDLHDGVDHTPNNVLQFPRKQVAVAQHDELLVAAFDAEDADDLETAIDYCHAILARDGARADISFQIAELLYRSGHLLAARERYYIAIELEPEFVEARASLANVLAETDQLELAVAAYRGALTLHDEYAEVHLGLAKTLDRMDRSDEALQHWSRFLQLSPNSPWAHEAKERLESPSLS